MEFEPGFVSSLYAMEGRVALITGGHGGFAESMAATLADLGCNIALASRKVDKCEELAARISERFGREVIALRCDISSEEEVAQTVDAVVERFGRLDVLVNNAGASWWGLPQDIPLKGWQKVMDVNLTGTFMCCREAAKRMFGQGGGSIINIASVGAYISYEPRYGQVVPYTTSKAAIVHLTGDLAAQWAEQGVRVNAIAPGQMESGMTDTLQDEYLQNAIDSILFRRLGKTHELSGILATLASDAGSFMTGQTYIVDGGQLIGR